MIHVLRLLVAFDVVALGGTSVLGALLASRESVSAHLLAGVLTAMLCTLTHVLVMFYLIGTGIDVRDAVKALPELARRFVPWSRDLKLRVFPWASGAIVSTIVATLLGAEVHSRLIVASLSEGTLPLRGVGAWWVHAAVVAAAFLANAAAFRAELAAAAESRRGIAELNGILEAAPQE